MGAPLLWKRVTTAHRIPMAMTVARAAVATVRVELGEAKFSLAFMAISSS
jgi:hypothetical protein